MPLCSDFHYHRNYVWIPVFTASVWLGTLFVLLITWVATGKPHYVSMEGSVPFISDIGADVLKPFFVIGCTITGVGFFSCLVIERWLRHNGRLVPEMRKREHVLATLAILGSFIGGIGLICLASFDTKRHTFAHRFFLFVFVLGVSLSAIFTVSEYKWISRDYPHVEKLQYAYIVKAITITVVIAFSIAFAATISTDIDTAAVLEWAIAIVYSFYLLTFWYDLRIPNEVTGGHRRLLTIS